MSLEALDAFAKTETGAVSHCARLVLVWLANRYSNRAGYAWPSIDKLAADLCVPRTTLVRSLNQLEAAGLIERKRGGGRVGNSTRYYLTFFASDDGQNMTPIKTAKSAARGTLLESTNSSARGTLSDENNNAERVPPADAKSAARGHKECRPRAYNRTNSTNGSKRGRARGTRRCPPDWLPPETFQTWVQQNTTLTVDQVNAELAKFHDHEFAKPKRDWLATFRNWLRRADEYNRKRPNGNTSVWDRNMRAAAEASEPR